jgi:glycosyltransferase involved in cell wall biosynthesis
MSVETSPKTRPLRIAWISDFPIEWLPDVPAYVRNLPKRHPLTWQRVLLEEFEACQDLQLHVCILRKEFERRMSFERKGITFHLLVPPPLLRLPSLFWTDTLLLKPLLREIMPDIVHAWGTEKGAALVAARLPYPRLVTLQGLISWLAQTVPVNLYFNAISILEKVSLRRCRYLTTESSFGVTFLRSHYPNSKAIQVEHAPNNVFHQLARQPQYKPLRFLFVGSLSYAKGTDLLFHAMEQLSNSLDFELLLISAGRTDFFSRISSRMSKKIGACVKVKDNLPPEGVAKEMSLATMLIFPTRADNSPNAVKEAAVAGLPVVASSSGGIPEYIFPGKNGFLFSPGSLEGLTAAIRSACEHPLFSKGIVDGDTLRTVRDYLAPSRMADGFRTAYQRVLAGS